MKYRIALLSIATLLASTAYGLDKEGRGRLIEDLIRVESGGKANAVGDNGKAYGCLQIHATMVLEANRIVGKGSYTHHDMFDPVKAKEVAEVVLRHYSNHIRKTTGREATRKELAFVWNGGGSAWKRATTPVNDSKQRNLELYWSKVSAR